jgi:hypothetical protein
MRPSEEIIDSKRHYGNPAVLERENGRLLPPPYSPDLGMQGFSV